MNETALVPTQEPFSLAPQNLEQAMQYAKLLAESSVVPQSFQKKPADILVAVQLGMEIGFSPVQALQNIAVINGRPSIWGQGVAALIIASPVCEYLKLPSTDEIREKRRAVVVAKRKGHPEDVGTFDESDAQLAKLTTKDTYAKWWPDMYLWRAFHRATKIRFSDVLKGLLPREISEDFEVAGTTPEGQQLFRRPNRGAPVSDQAVSDFLKDGGKPSSGNGHTPAAPTRTIDAAAPEVAADGAELVGVISASEGVIQNGPRKGEKYLKVTLARKSGDSIEASCFSTTAAAAIREAEGAGLGVWVKTETKLKDGKQYVNVTEATVEGPADGSPE